MTKTTLKVFLDTSVIFAAVLSPTGGARVLFQLGELGILHLIIGPGVLQECDQVVRRKSSDSLPMLAALLDIAKVKVTSPANQADLERARAIVEYPPDAHILAEAITARPDWFITHDKQHLLKQKNSHSLDFIIGTPGDLLQHLGDALSAP